MGDSQRQELPQLRAKVGAWLDDAFEGVERSGEYGFDFGVRFEREQVFLVLSTIGPRTMIRVSSPLVYRVPEPTEGLRHYVLKRSGNWAYGGFFYFENDEGANVSFVYSVLGDHVVEEEVLNAVDAVWSAARVDTDEMHAQFGGEGSLE